MRHDAIGGVARRQDQHPRAEKRIDDRVEFAVAAAFREPDRLKFGPPFPPLAQRCALPGLSPTRLVPAARKERRPPRISSAKFPASSGQSDCRSSCGGRTPSGNRPSGSQPRAPTSFPIFPSGGNQAGSLRSHLHDPAQISRSSLRRGPGWFAGKSGSIFAHCSSLNQNKCASIG